MPPIKRRRSSKTWLPPLIVVLLLALLILFLLLWQRRQTEIRYPEFGINIPAGYSIHGIDVSRYQDKIDWQEVKNMQVQNIKVSFVFIKATEGEEDVDKHFSRNWKAAVKHDLPRGAYHYFIPTKDAVKQAMHFIRTVKLKPGDLPPVLDVEQSNNMPPQLLRNKIKIWLKIVGNHYHTKPILYTHVRFYEKFLDNEFDDYPLWIAHYYERQQPRINRSWTLWQHNDQGRVNGISTFVDFNVFNGDSAAFELLRLH